MKVTEDGDVIGTDIIPVGLTKSEKEAVMQELGSDIDPMDIIAELRGRRKGEVALEPRPGHESSKPLSAQNHGATLVKKHVDRAVLTNMPLVIEKLLELAEGIYVEQEYVTKKGVIMRKVYKRPPDFFALRELLDRGLGKTSVNVNKVETKDVTIRVVKMDV